MNNIVWLASYTLNKDGSPLFLGNVSKCTVYFVRNPLDVWSSYANHGAIIRFLQLDYDRKILKRAVIDSDFKILQQMEKEQGFREKMQLCENFFWKGEIGNYREYLSEEQIQRIVKYNYEVMKDFVYIYA
jgi:hypothetical protein